MSAISHSPQSILFQKILLNNTDPTTQHVENLQDPVLLEEEQQKKFFSPSALFMKEDQFSPRNVLLNAYLSQIKDAANTSISNVYDPIAKYMRQAYEAPLAVCEKRVKILCDSSKDHIRNQPELLDLITETEAWLVGMLLYIGGIAKPYLLACKEKIMSSIAPFEKNLKELKGLDLDQQKEEVDALNTIAYKKWETLRDKFQEYVSKILELNNLLADRVKSLPTAKPTVQQADQLQKMTQSLSAKPSLL